MKPPRENAMLVTRCFSLTLLNLIVGVLFSPAILAAPAPTEDESKEANQTCELILRGREIEALTLESFEAQRLEANISIRRNTKLHDFSSPRGVIKLPPGHYEITNLTLPKGITACLSYPREEFELTAEKPYELVIEGFSCKVTAERIGPFLNFDFQGPTDSQGRKYLGSEYDETEGATPGYRVLLQGSPHGKEIASGTLEYG